MIRGQVLRPLITTMALVVTLCLLQPAMVYSQSDSDPTFEADKPNYDVGDMVTVTIADPDSSFDSDDRDTLTGIRVTSDSDQVGIQVSALETGDDTGIFVLSFETASVVEAGKILVKDGDEVTIEYEDENPADSSPSKKFTFVIPFGTVSAQSIKITTNQTTYRSFDAILVAGEVESIAPASQKKVAINAISLEDVGGQKIEKLVPGEQVVIAAELANNENSILPYAAIVEVRDAVGITVSLSWQTGNLNPSDEVEIGLSWTPAIHDRYQVRLFVVDNLASLQSLSDTAIYDIESENFRNDIMSNPIVLKIEDPNGMLVRLDQVDIKADRTFEYEFRLAGVASSSGTYAILASYDGEEDTAQFDFTHLASHSGLSVEASKKQIDLAVSSNSAITGVDFDQKQGILSIEFEGDSGTAGILYAIFPNYLLDDVQSVSLDGQDYPYEDLSTDLYTIIKIEYTHSRHEARIPGLASELTTSGNYEIWYRWDRCQFGNLPADCGISRAADAILTLNFLYPGQSPVWVRDVGYFIEIDNLGRIDRPIVDHRDIIRIRSEDLASMTQDGQTYGGRLIITSTVDSDSMSQQAPLSVLIVPEFSSIMPFFVVASGMLIVLVVTRQKFRMR